MTKKHKPSRSQYEAYFRRGTELLHQAKPEQAIPLLEKAYEMEPTHFDTAVNLSGAYILTKKFQTAVTILEPLTENHSDNPVLWTNLGAAYLGNPVLARDEEQMKAIAAFERAIELDPVVPNVAYNIGLIYHDRHENEQAVAWFQRALQVNPNDRDAQSLIRKLSE
jgi:tetratricopeptide (TPR) repeat protein